MLDMRDTVVNVIVDDGIFEGPGCYILTNGVEKNKDEGRFYIGATSNGPERLQQHLKDLRLERHVNSGITEHIGKSPKIDVLFLKTSTPDEAFKQEKMLVDILRKEDNCLNIRGARPSPMLGRIATEEQKEKARQIMKNLMDSGEWIPPNIGIKPTPEAIKKTQATWKSKYENGYISPSLGKKHSDEFRALKSKQTTEHMKDQKVRDHLSVVKKIQMRDPELVERCTRGIRALDNDPVSRKRHSEFMVNKFADPEWKKTFKEKQMEGVRIYQEKRRALIKEASLITTESE